MNLAKLIPTSLVMMLVPVSGYATLDGSDNFDDNRTYSSKWRVDRHSFGTGEAKLTERNGQVELTSVKAEKSSFTSWQWRKGSSSPSQSWTAQFDAQIRKNVSGAALIGIGVEVFESDSDDFAGVALVQDEKGLQVESYLFLAGERTNIRRSTPLKSPTITIRMDYNGRDEILSIFYDENGSEGDYRFNLLAEYGIGSTQGVTASADWKMEPSSKMKVRLTGFCKQVRIAPRQVALDNFKLLTLLGVSAPIPSPFDSFSERELQITSMIVHGQKSKEIAEKLSLSLKTVDSYRYRILVKANVKNDVELTLLAIKVGLINANPDVD